MAGDSHFKNVFTRSVWMFMCLYYSTIGGIAGGINKN